MADQDVLKEFLVSLSFKVREDEARRFNETVEKATKGILAIGTALGALEIAQKFERTAASLNSVYYAATRAGTAFGKLLDLQNAFTLAGGTKEQATELVASVERKFNLNMAGIGAAFERWTGKSAFTDTAHTHLRDVVDLIREMDAALAKRTDITPSSRIRIEEETFGASRDAMLVFRDAQKLTQEMAGGRNIWGIDEKTAEHARQFDQAMQRLKITLENIWEGESAKLFERWGERLKYLNDFLNEHAEGIKTAVDLITEPIIILGTVLLLRVVPGLNGLLAALGALTRFALPAWLLSLLGVPGPPLRSARLSCRNRWALARTRRTVSRTQAGCQASRETTRRLRTPATFGSGTRRSFLGDRMLRRAFLGPIFRSLRPGVVATGALEGETRQCSRRSSGYPLATLRSAANC